MRILLLPICIILLLGCFTTPIDQMRFSGQIENPDETQSVRIYRGTTLLKDFPLSPDGKFDDIFEVEEGLAFIVYGSKFKRVYVKNGFNTRFTVDNGDFYNTADIKGDGSDIFALEDDFDELESQYSDLIIDNPTLEYFESASANYRNEFISILDENDIDDSTQVNNLVADVDDFISRFRVKIESRVNVKNELQKGDPSPTFVHYENLAGGFSSLSDFRGKYVYIDFWTTWCGPCLKEFPTLKELEAGYSDRNIEFLYISLDAPQDHRDDPDKARQAWINYVEEHELGGVQLFSDKAFDSDFVKDYKIDFIPRYVLIDPEGKIISADAPRPSNPALVELFNELGI